MTDTDMDTGFGRAQLCMVWIVGGHTHTYIYIYITDTDMDVATRQTLLSGFS